METEIKYDEEKEEDERRKRKRKGLRRPKTPNYWNIHNQDVDEKEMKDWKMPDKNKK